MAIVYLTGKRSRGAAATIQNQGEHRLLVAPGTASPPAADAPALQVEPGDVAEEIEPASLAPGLAADRFWLRCAAPGQSVRVYYSARSAV